MNLALKALVASTWQQAKEKHTALWLVLIGAVLLMVAVTYYFMYHPYFRRFVVNRAIMTICSGHQKGNYRWPKQALRTRMPTESTQYPIRTLQWWRMTWSDSALRIAIDNSPLCILIQGAVVDNKIRQYSCRKRPWRVTFDLQNYTLILFCILMEDSTFVGVFSNLSPELWIQNDFSTRYMSRSIVSAHATTTASTSYF